MERGVRVGRRRGLVLRLEYLFPCLFCCLLAILRACCERDRGFWGGRGNMIATAVQS